SGPSTTTSPRSSRPVTPSTSRPAVCTASAGIPARRTRRASSPSSCTRRTPRTSSSPKRRNSEGKMTTGPANLLGRHSRRPGMKIVVIGGSGLIGKKLIPLLRAAGYHPGSGSPPSGVNTLTGDGLAGALAGADVVVDVTNSPSFEDTAVLEFFEKSTRNILATEAAASVKHHVALSVVGADRFPDSGYMRAKVAQEKLIKASGAPS